MIERPMELYRRALERLTGAAFQPGSVSFASRPCRPEEDADTLLAFALDDLERMRLERDTATVPETEEIVEMKAEVDRLRVENERLQREADNPALRDSVMAGLDQELQAAHREELKAKADAKRLRGALEALLDAHQYGHGDRWGVAWADARAVLSERGTP